MDVWIASHISSQKRLHFFEECLQSLRDQTNKNFTLCISISYDNKVFSREEIKKVVDTFEGWKQVYYCYKRLSQFQHYHNIAKNRIVLPKYVTLVDDDDISLPQRIEKVLDIFKRNEHIKVVDCKRKLLIENPNTNVFEIKNGLSTSIKNEINCLTVDYKLFKLFLQIFEKILGDGMMDTIFVNTIKKYIIVLEDDPQYLHRKVRNYQRDWCNNLCKIDGDFNHLLDSMRKEFINQHYYL